MHRRPLVRRASSAALIGLALVVVPAGAGAAPPPGPAPTAADRFLDVRIAERDRAAATGNGAGLADRSPQAAARVDRARAALTAGLGRQAVLDVDPLTGSVRQLTRLDGALTSPTGAAPATTARTFAREHATALGLDAQDVDALTVAGQERSATGLTVVRLAQQIDGIPSFDSGLRVAVDHAGRVLSVAGAPRSDLPQAVTPSPPLSALDALQRLADQSGTGPATGITVTSTAQDAQHTTRFSTGDVARLVLFGADTVRLAWHLTYQASSTRWYDAVVDAATGRVLYRANLVKQVANASVYTNYPGAANGGTQATVDLEALGYLPAGATTLSGPNVHAWSDVNDDNAATPTEEVAPGPYPAVTDGSRANGACDVTHLCTWNHTVTGSWTTNRAQNVTQTFWYANNFHDHLASGPIGFTAASGNFEGADALQLNALDGAQKGAGGGPDADHINNANMATPPDGLSPKMQMYLFAHTAATSGANFRDVNGGDDAAVLYHEYTHGLSSRLVTNDDGSQALNSAQSGAMGEGWSDWYAQDYLVRTGLQSDAAGTDGEIDMGRYLDALPHSIRHQALDCAVGSANATACPGTAGSPGVPTGGYTFGDFGRISGGGPEVHADGEIWAQTLWQLRQELVAQLGEAVGSDTVERIVTDAMRLSIAEPSFLDMRNAILTADRNATGGANGPLIWGVFRSRGMGFFATVDDSGDTAPTEDFSAPPDANTPRGAIGGTVTDRQTGAPLAGTVAGIAGLSTDPSFETYLAGTADGAGHYAISGLPAGAYRSVTFRSPAGYDGVKRSATVVAGQTTTLDVQLQRDWAAAAGGGRIVSTNDDTGQPYGCGVGASIDQSRTRGWSAENHAADANPARRYLPALVLQLPQAIDVSTYGIDPTSTCGDDQTAALKGYRLETSPDASNWTTSAEGDLAAVAPGTLTTVQPAAATSNVRYVRVTLKSPQSAAAGTSGAYYIDLSELEIYGTPVAAAAAPAPAPGTPTPPPADPAPVSPANPAPSPTVRARPSFALPRAGTKGRARVKVTCRDACRVGATLTVDAATKRRYGLRSRTVGRLATRTVKGTKTLTVTLTADARKRLKARHRTKLRVGLHLTATVTGAGGSRRTAARNLTIRL
ncbi:MAG: extracellular elastinolytic metalloproteinase [Baekduia sp.]|nr:extracellular elastinolytic metalloproteinase [Baekduia sp.]